MTFLLDTDICSYLMRRRFPKLIERVRAFEPNDLKISVVTAFELRYGAKKSPRPAHFNEVIDRLLANLKVLDFDLAAAHHSASIRAELTAKGTPIGAYALQIAGHARSLEATLVTNNVGEFRRVQGLKVENWTQ